MLGNLASASFCALILPFALLMSFIAMEYFGLTANLMSLGGLAIAIGMLVDSAVVMVEHSHSRAWKSKHKREYKLTIIKHATIEMAPSHCNRGFNYYNCIYATSNTRGARGETICTSSP